MILEYTVSMFSGYMGPRASKNRDELLIFAAATTTARGDEKGVTRRE